MYFRVMHKCAQSGMARWQGIRMSGNIGREDMKHCLQCGLKLSLQAGERLQPYKLSHAGQKIGKRRI